ncbi:MAG: hypothetical protein HQ488_03935 [Parcubacteria group bacterium]|nr:hypothetical protein [Parcubacteria group bacterium]
MKIRAKRKPPTLEVLLLPKTKGLTVLTEMIGAAAGVVPAGLKTAMRTSLAGELVLRALTERRTPGIKYVSGDALLALGEDWYKQIEQITKAEPHLLTKTRLDLEPAAIDGRVTLAIDTGESDRVVGCIVLWELERDQNGHMWYELGTFVVVPDHRYGARGPKAMPIADALYRRVLHAHRTKNILGTTTNIHAIHTGQRHGMQMVSFHALPSEVHLATCICPISKTGTSNNAMCRIKDANCRVRVPHATWTRMGSPTRLPYP